MLVSDLIDRIPSATRTTVSNVVKRYNNAVREALRSETRLTLQKHSGEDRDETRIPVKVTEIGMPEQLKEQRIPEGMELAALLAPWQEHLRKLRESSVAVQGLGNHLGGILEDRRPKAFALLPSVVASAELAEELLKESDRFDLLRQVFAVNTDVLGVYECSWNELGHDTDRTQIKLYWGIIGLTAAVLGVSVETLTVLVLAHELAHAYTHVGYDIDEQRWYGYGFSESDHSIREGLAQYYTARVLFRLKTRLPDGEDVFYKLLTKQPVDYWTQMPWLAKLTPEIIRATFVRLRMQGQIEADLFWEELCEDAQRMGKGKLEWTKLKGEVEAQYLNAEGENSCPAE